MNPWKLYDELIEGIPGQIMVSGCNCGYNWTTVTTEDSVGLSMTIPVFSLPYTFQKQIAGIQLQKLAKLSKSWNFVEAALGVAAIGAYYNYPSRARNCGMEHPGICDGKRDAFNLYQDEVKGRKVVIVGHFPMLEQRFGPICDMTILERNPQWGDTPDTACEYILGDQDYVFITGCTLVNKTMPRLLELSKNAKVVLVGPSTILSPILFEHGVYGLSGLIVHDIQRCENVLREGNTMKLFDVGEMVDYICPSK